MVGCIDVDRSMCMRSTICASLQDLSVCMQPTQGFDLYLPGRRNRGYGFVDIPILMSVVSGLS